MIRSPNCLYDRPDELIEGTPSVYYEQKARERDPSRLPDRAKRDAALSVEIERAWMQNRCVYGAHKV